MTQIFLNNILIILAGYLVIGGLIYWLTGELAGTVREAENECRASGSRKLTYNILVFTAASILWPCVLASWWEKRKTSRARRPYSLEQYQLAASALIVRGYRRIFAQAGIGAAPEMPDSLVVELYTKVTTSFRSVGERRGDLLDAGMLNNIALHFLELYRTMGEQFFEAQLQYECTKYEQEGLREDYVRPLHLF